MFTHLYQRDHFSEEAVRIYIGEIILALEHLHKVGNNNNSVFVWFFCFVLLAVQNYIITVKSNFFS